MMKRTNKLWLALLFALLVVALVAVGLTAAAEETPNIVASGFCGEDGNEESIGWSMDETGALNITGAGPIKEYGFDRLLDHNYTWYSKAPWRRLDVTSVTIGKGVTTVSDCLFVNCVNLTQVTLPDSVEHIGDYTFKGCTALQSIRMPATMQSIGREAFRDCSALTKITIPDGVAKLMDYAFLGCTALESIDFPDTLVEMDEATDFIFSVDAPWFAKQRGTIVYCGHVLYWARDLSEEYAYLEIREDTTQIWKFAFVGNDNILSLSLPANVKFSEGCFADCRNLKEVTIAEGITELSQNMFFRCYALEKVALPQSLKRIRQRAFMYCTSLITIVIPNNVETIDNQAFDSCSGLSHFAFPTSLKETDFTKFYTRRFPNCSCMMEIYVPLGIEGFGSNAFIDADRRPVIYFEGTREQWDANGVVPENVQVPYMVVYESYRCDWRPISDHEPIETVETVLTPAGCLTEGTMLQTTACVFCGKKLGEATRPIPPRDHTPGKTAIENKVAATCTTAGSYDEVIYCTRCDYEFSRTPVTVAPLNHPNAQTVAAISSTCKENGFAAGIYCSDCDTWISGHEALPLADHSFGGWVVTQQPTIDRSGTETRTCSVCGETETRSIDKLPQPDNGGNDNDGNDNGGSFIDTIRDFFQKILDFFKNLFNWMR